MRKNIVFVIVLSLNFNLKIFCNTGIAYIENPQVIDTTFSWEVHYERTDEWTADTLTNVLGSSAASFNFNNNALTSPSILIESGSPLDNANYSVMIKIISGKCIINIDFNPLSSAGEFPLNTKVKLLTITMLITDPVQTAALSWDGLNTGFFDNADQNVNTTLNGSFNEPLPVELTSFTAAVVKNDVILEWQTETEIDNYGFEIQRKIIDRIKEIDSWEVVGFVEGSGNSNSPKEYSFADKKPAGGSKFSYRLKQIDNNGKYTYSKAITVELIPIAYQLFQNYPNPFNPITTIKFTILRTSLVTLKVYDIIGQEVTTLINEILPAGNHKAHFNAGGFASGVYLYRLESESFVNTKKMTHLK